jgi:PleD family two-component response regulator
MGKNLLRIAFADDSIDDHLFFFEAVRRSYDLALINNFMNSEDLVRFFTVEKNIAPHIFFLDKNMPGNYNYECLLQVKNTPLLSAIPVIIYSTSDNPVEVVDAVSKGACDFITKPVTITETVSLLKKSISSYVPFTFQEKVMVR